MKFYNKKRCMNKIFLCALLQLFFNPYATALDIIPSNSSGYYELGGGSDVNMPPVTTQNTLTVGSDASVRSGYDCSSFNPAVSISNTFNNMQDSIEGLDQSVIESATAAIGALPMMLLEKANPELYDMIQNTLLHGMDTYDLSLKDCQTALNQIDQGEDPYRSWFSVSDSQGWLKYANEAKKGRAKDINHARAVIDANPSQFGVKWTHSDKNAGGNGQPTIHVIRDVTVAGYNVLLGRPSLDDKAPAPSTSALKRYWLTPQAAGQWATLVLGDITVSADKRQTTVAGMGLATLMQTCPSAASNSLTCMRSIAKRLTELVQSSAAPTAAQLAAVSSPSLLVSPHIITVLKNLQPQMQAVAISKLASDVAMQNTLDEALLLRRVLIAGSQTKPVQSLKPALTVVNHALAQLNSDMQDLTFDMRIRKQAGTDSLQTLLAMGGQQSGEAAATSQPTQEPLLEHGAVYTTHQNPQELHL